MNELKLWGQRFPDGSLRMHIQGGIAPYAVNVSMSGTIVYAQGNIQSPKFNYQKFGSDGNYDDCNCIIQPMPLGEFKIVVLDSSTPPDDVRVIGEFPYSKSLSEIRRIKLQKLYDQS